MRQLLGSVTTFAIILFLISAMLSVGLELRIRDCFSVLRNRGLLARAIIANFVVVPLLGLAITRILPMPPGIETGFLLLATAPGALFAINFTRQMHGSVPVAASLLLVLTVLSLIVTPPLAQLLLRVDHVVTLDYFRAMRVLLFYVLAPLLVGFALARSDESFARRLQKPTSRCAGVLFIVVTVITFSLKSQATRRVGISGLVAMTLMIVGSMIVGWFLGGPDDGSRRVLALNTSMRNVALCLAIAIQSFASPDVEVAVVAFNALTVPAALLFTIYHTRRLKQQTAPPARSTSKRDAA